MMSLPNSYTGTITFSNKQSIDAHINIGLWLIQRYFQLMFLHHIYIKAKYLPGCHLHQVLLYSRCPMLLTWYNVTHGTMNSLENATSLFNAHGKLCTLQILFLIFMPWKAKYKFAHIIINYVVLRMYLCTAVGPLLFLFTHFRCFQLTGVLLTHSETWELVWLTTSTSLQQQKPSTY